MEGMKILVFSFIILRTIYTLKFQANLVVSDGPSALSMEVGKHRLT